MTKTPKSKITPTTKDVYRGPTSIAKKVVGNRPLIVSKGGSTVVHHRELVSTVSNNPVFTTNNNNTQSQRLNPMNGVTFPWLATMAANFDQYEFLRVELDYVPMCSSLTPGRVVLWFDKDSQDPLPVDRVAVANYLHTANSNAWTPNKLTIPTDRIRRFVFDNVTADLKLIDLGQFGWSVYGGTDTAQIGDLYITYTVQLIEPQSTRSLVQTQSHDNTRTRVTTFGVPYMNSGYVGTTDYIITFNTTGVFIVDTTIRFATFLGTDTNGTGAIVNSSAAALGVAAGGFTINITVTAPGQQWRVVGTLVTASTTHVVRADVANIATVL